ncbi:MAG: two pore domain potassium channel family protein [Ruminococcus sp.]|nr:two pore domain potassium channel family protein [Ruminococcus sp.]
MASEVFYGLMILIVTFSVVFQAFEPDINTFGDGMWYCFALVTTIGFGDMTAVTVIGRVLSVILGIYGIIVVALITSIIINFYNETKDFVMNDESGPEEELPEKDAGSQPPAEK